MIPSADVFGLFITIGGIGNLAHWFVGGVGENWDASDNPSSYYPLYAMLSLLVLLSLAGLPCLHAIRKRERGAESEAS